MDPPAAERIVAVDVNPQKLSLARNFGATDVIDGGKENALDGGRTLQLPLYLLAATAAAAIVSSAADVASKAHAR